MATEFTKLSQGKLARILNGETVDCPLYFQILGHKVIPAGLNQQNRYRLVVSDGITTHNFAMLASNLNSKFEEGIYTDFSIVCINRFVPSQVNRNEKRSSSSQIIILFDVVVVHPGAEVGKKIELGGSGSGGNQDQVAPQQYRQQEKQKENLNANYSRVPQTTNKSQNDTMNTSVSNLSEHLTMPIENISPYQNKWVIKARVTAKSPMRSWSNAKGEGKLFNVDLQDESGEIRCTFFRDVADRFYDMLEVDKVFYISKAVLKPANKQYATLKNDYEMTAGNETVIQPCEEICNSIPSIRYNFITIDQIQYKNPGEFIDVIGICKEASEIARFTAKASGRELTKREVTLVDKTNTSINLTLWGNDAETFNSIDNPIILLKNVRIGEYQGGKSLSTSVNTVMKLNPESVTEAHQLRGWFENGGCNSQTIVSLSKQQGSGSGGLTTPWMTFEDAKINNLGKDDKAGYFQTMAMIHNVRSDNMLYKACGNNDCNKKVIEHDDGTYRCEKCNVSLTTFKYRLLVNMLIGDWTSNRWITVFAETAEKIFNKKAEELAEMMESNKDEFTSYITTTYFHPLAFKLRTKSEYYQDVPRNKITAIAVNEASYKDYNRSLIKNIQEHTGITVDNEIK